MIINILKIIKDVIYNVPKKTTIYCINYKHYTIRKKINQAK